MPEVIKVVLNLAEFIERCDVGYFLPLDYHLLAEKAFQVKDYAKALHYVEEQFHAVMTSLNANNMSTGEFNGVGGVSGAGGGSSVMASIIANKPVAQQQQFLVNLLEQLVTLNHELQRTEAAMGVLDFASKYLKSLDTQTKVKERWYEKLHQWRKALNIYEKNLSSEQPTLAHLIPGCASSYLVNEETNLTEAKLDMLMGRMRCLKGLGEWQKLTQSSQNLLNVLESRSQADETKTTSTTTTPLTVKITPSLSTQSSIVQSASFTGEDLSVEILPRVRSLGLNTSASAANITSILNRNGHQRQSSVVTSPSTSNIGKFKTLR